MACSMVSIRTKAAPSSWTSALATVVLPVAGSPQTTMSLDAGTPSARLLRGAGIHRGFNFLRGDVAQVGCQRPAVPERVGELAVPVAPELILQRHRDGGPGTDRPLPRGVDVGQVQVDGHRAATEG